MRDVDHRRADLFVERQDLLAHLKPETRIQIRKGFVHQHNIGFDDQGAGQRHPLLLPARQLVRRPGRVGTHLHHPQGAIHTPVHLRSLDIPHRQTVLDVFPNRHMRPQRVVLKDHSGVSDIRGEIGHVSIPETHVPSLGAIETGDHPQQRRFATSGRPKQEEELSLFHFQADTVDGDHTVEPLRHLIESYADQS